ncbi:hypothetical protein MUO93_05360 [Candidatus Bathyarchaeota archaeon]|nr:hypothetical protein [Candidatus Bathyarchaeota archaeon]
MQEFPSPGIEQEGVKRMGLLSNHESVVWHEFQTGLSTGTIAEAHAAEDWTPAYVSRVLNRARAKIAGALKEQANSHRLDVESLLDYKGLLIGFDYQANAQVYAIYTERLSVVIWYRHDSYAGKLCPECPKEEECREALDAIIEEYGIELRPDEEELPMTQRSIAIFNKLAAKETPRYKRREESD